MSKLTVNENGRLIVPDCVTVPFITGDGVGEEIMPVCRKVVDAALKKDSGGKKSIEWVEVMAGERSFKQNGSWLPDETLEMFRDCLVGIKGPLTTPVGGGIRSLNVALRQTLDLYACVRPVRWFHGIESPLKEPWKVDMVIFRENTEDIYAGIEWQQGTPEANKFCRFLTQEMGVDNIRFPQTSAFGVKPVSIEGSERLVRAAIEYAIKKELTSVTLVHKGNIMKYTEGGFRNWGYELAAREFANSEIVIKDVIADAFLQNTLLHPEEYQVIATLNLNGDYISDQLAAMVGGVGIAPGANINYRTGHAVFEATHGTAPNIAGRNIANPSSLLLSAAMMLDYLGFDGAAIDIEGTMSTCFEDGLATRDLARFMPNGQALSTTEFGDEVIRRMMRNN